MLRTGRYRFSRHGHYKEGNPRCLWVCNKWSNGCRASITTLDGAWCGGNICESQCLSRHGHYKEDNPRCLWVCNKWSNGCRASITTLDGAVLKANPHHNH
ncbi:hypothetical protein NE865_01006 [Phthorimaea operculella]|nr:hypothetical protein NE865_01006 [Phthorimaea operculella]